MLRVSHGVMTLSVYVWPGSDVSRAVETGYRPIVQVNPDSLGDGKAYLLTQGSGYSELVPAHDLVIRMTVSPTLSRSWGWSGEGCAGLAVTRMSMRSRPGWTSSGGWNWDRCSWGFIRMDRRNN